MNWLLEPGDTVCRLVGLGDHGEHTQILRMFVNTVFWSIVMLILVATVMAVLT